MSNIRRNQGTTLEDIVVAGANWSLTITIMKISSKVAYSLTLSWVWIVMAFKVNTNNID